MKKCMTVFFLATAIGVTPASAATEKDVENSFFPYRHGVPTYPGLKVGMTIDKNNVGSFKEILDPATFMFIQKGWMKMKVGPTESIELHPNYIAATMKYAGQVKLGPKVGQLEGYVAGRPFPLEPDPKDPRAGEKLAFNYRHNLNIGDSGRIYPFIWEYRDMASGEVERTIRLSFNFLNYKHRISEPPIPDIEPNPAGYYRAIYIKALEPEDVRDTQVLIKRFSDDTKRDESYLYLGFQRRVRRMGSAQTTDAFLGSDLMIEDFEGYNGRVSDMKWKYVTTKDVLMPVYNHAANAQTGPKDDDGYGQVTYSGKGGCFANVSWSLRKAYVVEAIPVSTSSPIGKRIIYLDAQLGTIPVTVTYDRKNALWKRWVVSFTAAKNHISANKDSGIAPYTHATALDAQAEHCTTLSAKVMVGKGVSPMRLFSVQNMRGTR